MGKAPMNPKHPERICWGCDQYCPVKDLLCRETRAMHPVELFGDDWGKLEDTSEKPPPISSQLNERRGMSRHGAG